jgi:hypothetical protein
MKCEDQGLDEGAILTMAAIAAGKTRVKWMKSAFRPGPKVSAWRIVMDFDKDGDLVKYWESSVDGTGDELIGGGICRDAKPLRLSNMQIDVLLLGAHHKLDRSSMGWSYDDRVNWSDPVRIYNPVTIKALWNRGLLVGNFNDPRAVGNLGDLAELQNLDGAVYEHCVKSPKTPKFQVWTSDLGKEVLSEIGLLPDDTQIPSTRCEASDSPDCGVGDKAQDDKNGQCDEHPDYDRGTIRLRRPEHVECPQRPDRIKARPTASRVAVASTARRLNCRRRSSLVLNMADRSMRHVPATRQTFRIPAV